jgi:asparagine synthase (glutamine-hydrolysing)
VCGFIGILQTDGSAIDSEALTRATALLRHRGPDDEGYLVASLDGRSVIAAGGETTPKALGLPPLASVDVSRARLGLGFRRLAIQDPSPAGHQPMASADGSLWIVFNGEIYNHRELRVDPELADYPFRTGSDTETLLAAWQTWGPACVDRLEGMWAFAIWEVATGRVHLCRDRFGIKPLYWTRLPGGLAFASEIQPLLLLHRGRPQPRCDELYRYLRFGITDDGPHTLFEAISRLEPAHRMEIGVEGTGVPQRYWRLPEPGGLELGDDEAAKLVREVFFESVEAHLLSDVPLGMSLSGGIDSSAIVGAVRGILGAGATIRAFGHVVADEEIGEERWLRLAAEATRADVHTVEPGAEDLRRDLEHLIAVQEEPFGSTSIYAQQRVFALARETGTPVVLGGQGADEQLAGYRAYLGEPLVAHLRSFQPRRALRYARAAAALPGFSMPQLLVRAGASMLPAALQGPARRAVGQELVPAWMDGAWFRERGVAPAPPNPSGPGSPLRRRLRQAFLESSLPMLLRYEDRNAMSNSVESRVPFLDRKLVELLNALPDDQLIDEAATTKAVFRRAMRGTVPDPILDRRDKVGFATPERRWLGEIGGFVESQLADSGAVGGLSEAGLRREWHELAEGRGRFDFHIWRALNLIAWARRFDVALDDTSPTS